MVANQDLNITVKLKDEASPWLNKINWSVNDFADNTNKKLTKVKDVVKDNKEGFAVLWVWAWLAFWGMTNVINNSTDAAIKYQNAFVWLESIANWTWQSFWNAKKFIDEFTKDWLVPTEDAATSLKNLFARGFNLQESIDLMNRFKDSAAFWRQSWLKFWEAIAWATEWLKNENSLLVDNAWVTKNVAKMWEDYAKQHWISTNNMTLAQKRQAEYNWIMEETKFQVWDAIKYSDTYAGAVARQEAASLALSKTIWTILQPTMLLITTTFTDILNPIKNFAEEHPKLTSNIIFATTALAWITAALIAIWFLIWPITAAFSAIWALLWAIWAPVLIAIAAITALWVAWTTNFMGIRDITAQIFEDLKPLFIYLQNQIIQLWESAKTSFEGIKTSIITVFEFLQPYIMAALQIIKDFWTNHFTDIMNIIMGTWEIIKWLFQGAFDIISGIFQIFAGLFTGNWQLLWDGIVLTITGVWEVIKWVFSWAFQVIQWALGIFGGIIKAAWSALWLAFKALTQAGWDAIVAVVSLAWEGLKWLVNLWGLAISEAWTATMNGIKGVAEGIWGTIKNIFATSINWIIDKINGMIDSINNISGAIWVPAIPRLWRLQFQKWGIVPEHFQTGGIVAGGKLPANHDQIPAMLDPGELILNRAQQKNLAGQMTSGQAVNAPTININFSWNAFYGEDDFIDKIGDKIVKTLQTHISFASF